MSMNAPNSSQEVDALLDRIETREATVAVIGLGYVGLPLAAAFRRSGFRVIGFDIDPAKIEALNEGCSYFKHLPQDVFAQLRDSPRFAPTSDYAQLGGADALLICLPTPLTPSREPDLSYITSTAEALLAHLRRGQLVVLESTSYPGTTREDLKPILERSDLVSGQDFFLAYSPEREDPGNPDYGTADIPKVVGGDGPAALRLAGQRDRIGIECEAGNRGDGGDGLRGQCRSGQRTRCRGRVRL